MTKFEEALKYAKETVVDVGTALDDLEEAYEKDKAEKRRQGYDEGYRNGVREATPTLL